MNFVHRDPTEEEILCSIFDGGLGLRDLDVGRTLGIRRPLKIEPGEQKYTSPHDSTFYILVTPEFRMKILSDPRSRGLQA